MPGKDPVVAYREATARAHATAVHLGVLPEATAARTRLLNRVELFLWKFIRLRWYDIHRFFESVENKEAMELSMEAFQPGKVFHFFSERQDDAEWENTVTVGVSLVFAAMRQAAKRGFNPKTAGVFTLQRMLEQALDDVEGLEDLLARGAPP
jgi:hypothetical protein